MEIGIVVEGLEELTRQFNQFNEDFRKEVLTDLVLDCASIVAEEAVANAPVADPDQRLPKRRKAGALKAKGIGIMLLRKETTPDKAAAGVGFRRAGFYGIFSEFGTSHEGAKPFMIPAFERKKAEIYDEIGQVISSTADSFQRAGKLGFVRKRSFSNSYLVGPES